jgi:DNA-binding NarL/FixJ family response regulator
MGRPAFEPTAKARKFVAAMAALGVRHEEIATLLEITPKTLRKHFRSELDRGAIEANANSFSGHRRDRITCASSSSRR